jgi:hypothetical protein
MPDKHHDLVESAIQWLRSQGYSQTETEYHLSFVNGKTAGRRWMEIDAVGLDSDKDSLGIECGKHLSPAYSQQLTLPVRILHMCSCDIPEARIPHEFGRCSYCQSALQPRYVAGTEPVMEGTLVSSKTGVSDSASEGEFRIWAESWLRGSVRHDLTAEQRCVFIGLMALASAVGSRDGMLHIVAGMPLTRKFIAHSLNVPLQLVNSTIEACQKNKNYDNDRHRIEVWPDGTIELTNFAKYQSR